MLRFCRAAIGESLPQERQDGPLQQRLAPGIPGQVHFLAPLVVGGRLGERPVAQSGEQQTDGGEACAGQFGDFSASVEAADELRSRSICA
ncbi:hypothetical protein LV779_33975 [Streptomyces thinghirensis]|nr:hypothetical protein [Streptomyces thinghirensis]